MKINPTTGPRPQPPTRRGERASAGGEFSKVMGQAEARPAAVRATTPTGSIEALLALQELVGEEESRAKARTRAAQLLDRLDEVRHALLAGDLSEGLVQNLISLVGSTRPEVTDPQLGELLDEIDLRAQVELAKLQARGHR